MKRSSALLILTVLLMPPAMPAGGAREAGLPGWAAGDSWLYETLTESPHETIRGNLSASVTGEGRLRVGNETHSVWVLTLAREENGERYTRTTHSRVYVSKRTLCTIQSRSTIEVACGSLRSTGELTLTYSPSDGRYLFPLGINRSWRSEVNMTRTEVWEGVRRVSEECLTINHTCGWAGNITVGKVNYTAFLVNSSTEGSGNYTRYWYSESVRGDVRVEEYDAASGALTVMALKKYSRSSGPGPLLGPDSDRVLTLVGIALALLGIAAAMAGAPRLRRRLERGSVACPSCGRALGTGRAGASVRCPTCGRVVPPGSKMR